MSFSNGIIVSNKDTSSGCLVDLDHAKYTKKFSRYSRPTDSPEVIEDVEIVKEFLRTKAKKSPMRFSPEVVTMAVARFPQGDYSDKILEYIISSGKLYLAGKTPSKPITLDDLGWNSNVSA